MNERNLISAILDGDHAQITSNVGLTPGTVPRLRSANASLSTLLQRSLADDPQSALAMRVSEMLQQGTLFELFGKWPPDGNTIGGSPVVQRCPHCNKELA